MRNGIDLLVVVDYQNDFVSGSLGFLAAKNLDSRLAKLIYEFSKNPNGKIIYTLDTHGKNYLNTREGKLLPIEHCIVGTEGYEVYGETNAALKAVNAKRLCKTSFALSPATMLELAEEFDEVATVTLVGLVTNMCVTGNAIAFQATFDDAEIIVDASLCDSFDRELHDKSLDTLAGMQITVINR